METRFGSSRLDDLPSRARLSAHDASGYEGATSSGALVAQDESLVFDACHVGLILRTVLTVEVLVGVGVMFVTSSLQTWLSLVAIITYAALPAALLWLVVACALKRPLQRLSRAGQWFCGSFLGSMAALYGCAMLNGLGIVANPPWLASAVSGALIAAGLVAVLIWRAQQRAPAGAAARLSELQARIRPHFLFNTLNSAIALVRQEPARAEAMLEDLSELFRSALADPGESVALEQELELAQRYLAIEQVRFGPRLRLTWEIDPRSLGAQLPPLILQPLVENAVLHGVEPSASGAEVKISTQRRGSTVVIKITNTAPGGQGPAGNGLALKNAQERLALLHDLQCSFRCTWEGGVYQVRIEVPA